MLLASFILNSIVSTYVVVVFLLTLEYIQNGGSFLGKFLLYSGPVFGVTVILSIVLAVIALKVGIEQKATKKPLFVIGLIHFTIIMAGITAIVAYINRDVFEDDINTRYSDSYNLTEGDFVGRETKTIEFNQAGQSGRATFAVAEMVCDDQDPKRCLTVIKVSNPGDEPLDFYYYQNADVLLLDDEGNHYGVDERQSVYMIRLLEDVVKDNDLQTTVTDNNDFGYSLNPGLEVYGYVTFVLPSDTNIVSIKIHNGWSDDNADVIEVKLKSSDIRQIEQVDTVF